MQHISDKRGIHFLPYIQFQGFIAQFLSRHYFLCQCIQFFFVFRLLQSGKIRFHHASVGKALFQRRKLIPAARGNIEIIIRSAAQRVEIGRYVHENIIERGFRHVNADIRRHHRTRKLKFTDIHRVTIGKRNKFGRFQQRGVRDFHAVIGLRRVAHHFVNGVTIDFHNTLIVV